MMSSVLEWGERKGEERGKKGENGGKRDNRGEKIWKEKREEIEGKITKHKV